MARPKMPPKVRQSIDFDIMPPNRTLVRREVRRALKKARLRPVDGAAAVTITWVERDVQHSHGQISEGVMSMFATVCEMGIVAASEARLDAHQRLKATNPHIELVIEGRLADGAAIDGSPEIEPRDVLREGALESDGS